MVEPRAHPMTPLPDSRGVKRPENWGNRHAPVPAIPHHDWASEFR